MSKIVTVTVNPTIDESAAVERVVPDQKLRCGPPSYEPGGGGINVARAVRALGGEATALWTRGGSLGALMAELLNAEGLPHQSVPIRDQTRLNLTVQESSTNQQVRFVLPGPEISAAEAETFFETVAQLSPAPAYLVLSGSLTPGAGDDFYRRLIERAPEGARVILDTSGAALTEAVKAHVFLLKANLRELSQLAGLPLDTDTAIAQVARKLVDDGRATAVMTTLGAGGALLATADGIDLIRSPTVPIRSRVGAGDSSVAGTVLALSRGEPLGRAVRFGVAAGAAAVMTPGTELCRREDAERLFAEMTR